MSQPRPTRMPEAMIWLGLALFLLAVAAIYAMIVSARTFGGGGSDAFLMIAGLLLSYLISCLLILPALVCIGVAYLRDKYMTRSRGALVSMAILFLALPIVVLNIPATVLGPFLRG